MMAVSIRPAAGRYFSVLFSRPALPVLPYLAPSELRSLQ